MLAMLHPPEDPDLLTPLRPVWPAPPAAPYTVEQARAAWDSWRANCGPWALCAVLGVDLPSVRPLFPRFPERAYTKETGMRRALTEVGRSWEEWDSGWPASGLVRVAWDGPWWNDVAQDPYARLRRSHWIATLDTGAGRFLFDGNAIAEGGWITATRWCAVWAPHIASYESPEATGGWRVVDRFACGISPPTT
jgi:hypothetical protein